MNLKKRKKLVKTSIFTFLLKIVNQKILDIQNPDYK